MLHEPRLALDTILPHVRRGVLVYLKRSLPPGESLTNVINLINLAFANAP